MIKNTVVSTAEFSRYTYVQAQVNYSTRKTFSTRIPGKSTVFAGKMGNHAREVINIYGNTSLNDNF